MKVAIVGSGIAANSDYVNSLLHTDNPPLVIVDHDAEYDSIQEMDEIPTHLKTKKTYDDLYDAEKNLLFSAISAQMGSSTLPDIEPKFYDGPPLIQKGHSKFIIEGIEIYALNYKNALKKYENRSITKNK